MKIEEFSLGLKSDLKRDFSLRNYNWFKVGGKADYFYTPDDEEDLLYFLRNRPKDMDIIFLGAGSNILIRDGGIKGFVIKLGMLNSIMKLGEDTLEVGAGALNSTLSIFAMENSIGGMEFISGIPGTIGGGIAMNAGCFGGEFKDIIHEVRAVDLDGEIKTLNKQDLGFVYRGNSLKDRYVFLSVLIKGYKSSKLEIKDKLDRIKEDRMSSQPKGVLTGGSTYANPEGEYKAWQLIDRVGLRGYRVGGAFFSDKHCNFIINDKGASASDIEGLIEEGKKRVKEKFGITLHAEIKILGYNAVI